MTSPPSLLIYTNAKPEALTDTFGRALSALKPNIPSHQFVGLGGPLPIPEEGQVLLIAGKAPLQALQAEGHIPKGRTHTSLREKPIVSDAGGHMLATYAPGECVSDSSKRDLIAWDVRLADRLVRTGTTRPTYGDYRWVPDFSDLIARIKKTYAETGERVLVSADIETEGLWPWYEDKDLVCFGFTDRVGHADCMYVGPFPDPVPKSDPAMIVEQVDWLLTSDMVSLTGANFKFDLQWIAQKLGIVSKNFRFDTSLAGNLLDENRSNSLNVQTKLLAAELGGYDSEFNAKVDKGNIQEVPPDELLIYQGGDIDATLRVALKLRSQIVAQPCLLRHYVTILHPAARAFEALESRGVYIDREAFAQLDDDLDKEIAAQRENALQLLTPRLRLKHIEKIESQLAAGKDPLTGPILLDYFFSNQGLGLKPLVTTEKTGKPSTAASHLRMFADNEDAAAMCDVLEKLGSASKTRSTFVKGFLDHLRPDGRLHPTYMLFHGEMYGRGTDSGTVTGRLSAKNPAFQTLPKKTDWAKRIRKCYPAPPGKAVISCDFSQGELRVVACVAPEPTMIQSYKDGLDLHAVTGARLGGYDLDTFLKMKVSEPAIFAALRGQAKPANFGLLYGMGAEGFQAYAWAAYGLKLTLAEAVQIRDAFFSLYGGLTSYHTNYKALAHKHGQVVSPLGRIRHLPLVKSWDQSVRAKAERQAVNSPIQSCLSDMMLWAIALIEDAYPNGEIEIVGMIHDALIAYVPASDVELWAGRAVEVMGNLPFHELGWKPALQFPADAEAGPNLADMQELDFAA